MGQITIDKIDTQFMKRILGLNHYRHITYITYITGKYTSGLTRHALFLYTFFILGREQPKQDNHRLYYRAEITENTQKY